MEDSATPDHPGPKQSIAPLVYLPIREGQTRILCLHPGELGEPLKARFEIVSLEDARRAQPDLRSCDPERLDFDESQTSLRSMRKLLARHQEDCAALMESGDNLDHLAMELKSLLLQREALEQELRQDSHVSTNSRSDADEQVWFPDMNKISIERAALRKLHHERHIVQVENIHQMCDKYDLKTYTSLYKTARLLIGLSQVKRDDMVRDAGPLGAYETLSYAWGGSDFNERLQFEDCKQDKLISSTVFDALQQLRHRDQERRLWIDALCINQADLRERSHQISNMSQIYKSAARTIVWLGRADSSTCQAYGVLNAHLSAHTFNLGRDDSDSNIPFHITQAINSSELCEFCGESLPDVENKPKHSMHAMELLASKPWFTRLWVVQEIASATFAEVHCGAHQLSWDVFRLLMRMLCELRNVVWDINIATDLSDEGYSPCVLLWFLVVTSKRKCTLEIDRVYAVQSITGLTTNEVDGIGQELDHTQLFLRLAEHCMTFQCTTTLMATKEIGFNIPHVALLLALAPYTMAGGGSLPSWAPDWNHVPANVMDIMGEYSFCLSDDFRFGRSSNPSGPRRHLRNLNLMECHTKESRRRLSIRGYHFGEIAEVVEGSEYPFREGLCDDELPSFHDSSAWFDEERQSWFRICRRMAESQWPSCEFDVKLKELLLCESLRSGKPDYDRRMLGNEEFWRYMETGLPMPTTRLGTYNACSPFFVDKEGKVDPHKLAIWTCGGGCHDGSFKRLRNRKLCAIRTGFDEILLGWIPQSAEVGDRICLFGGAPRPYVVKPHIDGDGSFQLLGDSWVHGMCELDISDFCNKYKADLEWIDLK